MRQRYKITLLSAAAISISSAAHANVAISSGATSNMNCSGGICTATAADAVLNVSDLQTMLNAGNATVETGSIAASIVIQARLTWASANKLTLDAKRSIIVNQLVTVSGTGDLALGVNTGGHGGSLTFGQTGRIAFWGTSNALAINGVRYKLVDSIARLASNIAASPSGNFALSNNYDATADGTYGVSPIPTDYSGNLQGLHNTISHLKISDNVTGADVGLFTKVLASGTISNLRLNAIKVGGGDRKAIGGLVAQNYGKLYGDIANGKISGGQQAYVGLLVGINSGTVDASYTSGVVRGFEGQASGGLVGGNDSLIENSSSSASLTGIATAVMGGLVGEGSGSVKNSSASGSVSSSAGVFAGGLFGNFSASSGDDTISDSSASGSVFGSLAGGLVGDAEGDIVRCHATGDVSGTTSVGGLAERAGKTIVDSYATGSATLQATADSTPSAAGLVAYNFAVISRSFAIGTVSNMTSAAAYLGGFVGQNFGQISNSYSTGSISGVTYGGGFVGDAGQLSTYVGSIGTSYSTGAATGGTFEGGFVGENETGRYTDTYWNTTTSGTTHAVGTGNPAPIIGLTTAQLQSGLPAGFDSSIWAQNPDINNGFPYLIANPPPP